MALAGILTVTGCHKQPRPRIAALPPPPLPSAPPPAITPPPINLPITAPPVAPPPPAVALLDRADRAFAESNYDEAAHGYEQYLQLISSGGQRDQVLFNLGLSYALRPAPRTDWQRAAAAFKQLMDEYPQGPLRASANLILSLRAELEQSSADLRQRDQKIRQLTTELDRLKKIDADRRKRP
jgi:TolA-binding protein